MHEGYARKPTLFPSAGILSWISLVCLTLTLLILPSTLGYEYRSIQTPYLIDDFPLFTAVFLGWSVLMAIRGASLRNTRAGRWQGLALSALIALVFIGFWVAKCPYGTYADDIYNQGAIDYLNNSGHVRFDHPVFLYFEFPGMHILLSSVSQACGIDVVTARTFFMMGNGVAFTALLYALMLRVLGSPRLSLLCSFMAIAGSVVLIKKLVILTPGGAGSTLFLGTLLLLLPANEGLNANTISHRLATVVVFAAMVVSYLATSILMVLVCLGVCVISCFLRRFKTGVDWRMIATFVVIVAVWQVNVASRHAGLIGGFMPHMLDSVLSGEVFAFATTLAGANTGAALPWWANVARLFWWGLLAMGSLLFVVRLCSKKTVEPIQGWLLGGVIGLITLTAVGVISRPGGEQFYRYLLFGPLFCFPALLHYLRRLSFRSISAIQVLSLLVLLLAFPTFLTSTPTVSTDAIHETEISAGRFLRRATDDFGSNLTLYAVKNGCAAWSSYFVPNASRVTVPRSVSFGGDEDQLWAEENNLLQTWRDQQGSPSIPVYALSYKGITHFEHLLGVSSSHANWSLLRDNLGMQDYFYENGYVSMYVP